MPAPVIKFGDFTFNAQSRQLYKGIFRVRISASQLRLLTLFLDNPGHLLSRDEIVQHLWTETRTIDAQRGINTAISSLRTTLGDSSVQPQFIETTIGLGYRFIAPVEGERVTFADPVPSTPVPAALEALAERPEPRPSEVTPLGEFSTPDTLSAVSGSVEALLPARRSSAYRQLWAALAVLLVLASAAGVARMRWRPRSISSSPAAPLVEFEPVTSDFGKNEVTAAAISPDGSMLAYADSVGISLHRFDDATDKSLPAERGVTFDSFAWLPNGTKLLASGVDATTGEHEVWLLGQESYIRIALPDASNAEPSPDGTQIAFTRHDRHELWTSTLQGDNARELPVTHNNETLKFVVWSRDGSYLLLSGFASSAADGLKNAPPPERWFYRTVDVRTGKILSNTAGVEVDSGFLLSDGTLRFVNNSTPAGILDKTHTPESEVALDETTGAFVGRPTVAAEIPGRPALGLSSSRNGSRQSAVLKTVHLDAYLARLSDDGKTIAQQSQFTQGVVDAYPHAWSSGGTLLFERRLQQETAVFSKSSASAEARLIAKMDFDLFYPQRSPDSQSILFMAREPGANRIYRVPVEGGSPQRVPIAQAVFDFHCPTRAAASCVFSDYSDRKSVIYSTFDPVTGFQKELARTPWRPAYLGLWSLSPDGATIAVASDSSSNPGVDLFPLLPTGTARRFVPVPGHGIVFQAAWSADGKTLYVECRTKVGFDLIYVSLQNSGRTAGEQHLLASSSHLLYAVASSDGKDLALPIPTSSTNVWVRKAP